MTGEWIGFSAIVGPIILVAMFFFLVAMFFWLRFKNRADMQNTIRAALDKGQELSPELIDRLGHPKDRKNKDLRLGVIWFAIAVGLVLIGIASPEEEVLRGTLAGASFPFVIGVAYMILHRFTGRDE